MAERLKGDGERTQPGRARWLHLFSRSAGVTVALIGGAVLVGGWAFGIEFLRSIPLGSVSMKANTALGLLAAGVALWLLQEGAGANQRRAGRLCASLTALIGILTLVEYGFDLNLGIDELLFADRSLGAGLLPGRPAISTALAFLLLGLSLFTLDWSKRGSRYLADGLALGAGFNALAGLLGLTIDQEALGAFMPSNVIAVHTLISIMLLTAGLVTARPRRGLFHRNLRIVFVCALSLFFAVTWTVWQSFALIRKREAWATRTREEQTNLNQLLARVQEVEGGTRGFVITGERSFLDGFETGVGALAEQQRRLDRLVRDPEMRAGLTALAPLISDLVAFDRRTVELRQSRGFEAARQSVASGRGNVMIDRIRARLARLNARQVALLDQRSVAARRELENVTRLIAGIACLSGAMLVVVFALLLRESRLRQEANLALHESETMFRSFFDLSPDLVCISDIVQGRFRRVNAAFSRVLGYSEGELLDKPFMELIHPDDWDSTARVIAAQLDRGESVLSFENRYMRKDGGTVWLEWSARPIPEKGLSFGIARDITARRQADSLILQLNVELRDRAGQLEEANRELETFSYSVSHDLRAPLRHIQGYVEMLTAASAGQLTGEAPRYLATISDASVEMSHLIDDLLEFSRVGRVEFSERRASLDKLVKGVMQSAEWVGQARQVVWRIGPLPEVVGDPSMLRQVFVNLLGNALKYSRDRDPAVIEIGCAGEESGRAILFVRDNGAGFDMQYAHKLFGVFQRLHRTDQFEGTGIGLALVRRIIGRHGGRTWAEGATDHGATFYFTLQPASALQQPTVDPSEMTREQPEERPWTTSKAS